MAKTALATLESALRARKLDRTLTSALPPPGRIDASTLAPTGVVALDAGLGGGLPRGQLSEIAGPCSSGRTTMLLHAVAAATCRGEIAAIVDACDRLDVASLVAAGADLARVLWVRGDAGPPERAVDRALKACTLVLQAGGFGLVALDLVDVPLVALKRLPFTTWLRLQRIVEGRDTACVLVVAEPLARSAGGVTVALGAKAAWAGDSDRSRVLDGLDVGARLLSPRRFNGRQADGAVHVRCGTRG